jgi:hypothetical protein
MEVGCPPPYELTPPTGAVLALPVLAPAPVVALPLKDWLLPPKAVAVLLTAVVPFPPDDEVPRALEPAAPPLASDDRSDSPPQHTMVRIATALIARAVARIFIDSSL